MRRTNPTGPRSAKAAARIPKKIVQAAFASKPKSSSESALAAAAMMISSNVAQPRHWTAFRAVGMYEPRRPSGARSRTIDGTRASAPISPAVPTIAFPIRPPTRIARSASRSVRAGTRSAPMTRTSSETPRFPQSASWSKRPSVRRRSGTGSMPQRGRPVVHCGDPTASCPVASPRQCLCETR